MTSEQMKKYGMELRSWGGGPPLGDFIRRQVVIISTRGDMSCASAQNACRDLIELADALDPPRG